MIVFIVSYKKNGKWNETLATSMKRFKDMGYQPVIVEGYSLKKNPQIKPNEVCFLNTLNKVFSIIDNYKNNLNNGFLVAEDDAYPNDFLTPEFLLKRLSKSNFKESIVRVGYQKKYKQKGKGYPLGYYLVGTQIVWYPFSILEQIKDDMEKKKPQHLDGYLSKLKDISVKILDEKEQKTNKYVFELQHKSATTGKTRLGLILGNATDVF